MYCFTKNIMAHALSIGLLFFLLSVHSVNARDASLTDIEVSKTESDLLLYFRVDNCFTEDMKEAIDSGIVTTFNFFIRVYKVRGFLWDKKIADIKVKHDVQFDGLKKVYMVRLLEKDDEPIFIKDFDGVKKQMSEISGLRIVDLQKIKKGVRYQVRMMVELDKVTLPFYLHNVFFFLSLWDFETDWYTVDFRY